MACGTPVLAFGKGAVPEVVDPGVTGEIVSSMEEAVRVLPRLMTYDRGQVRRHFEKRFSVERMASDYVAIYGDIIASHQLCASVTPPQKVRHVHAALAPVTVGLRFVADRP